MSALLLVYLNVAATNNNNHQTKHTHTQTEIEANTVTPKRYERRNCEVLRQTNRCAVYHILSYSSRRSLIYLYDVFVLFHSYVLIVFLNCAEKFDGFFYPKAFRTLFSCFENCLFWVLILFYGTNPKYMHVYLCVTSFCIYSTVCARFSEPFSIISRRIALNK